MISRVDPRTGLEELSRQECLARLARSPIGRFAVVVRGRPLIFPVNFTLDGDAVVFRTAEGTKLHASHHGPVAFECDGIEPLYHTGWSVLVVGTADEVRNPIDVARLERLPLTPWCDAAKPVWLRIRADSITGRQVPSHAGVPTERHEEAQ